MPLLIYFIAIVTILGFPFFMYGLVVTSWATEARLKRITWMTLGLLALGAFAIALSLVHSFYQIVAVLGWAIGMVWVSKSVFFPSKEEQLSNEEYKQ